MNKAHDLDPIVERTRQARADLARQCDYDVDKLFELLKTLQEKHPQRVRAPQRWNSTNRHSPLPLS